MGDATNMGSAPVSSVVAMVRVADVMVSAKFYRHLGFEIGNAVPREQPHHWAWLYQPKAPNWKTGANLMLVSNDVRGATANGNKTVLFYLYARDLKGLREELLAKGFRASDISYPDYLPEGEFRLEDPDGYTLMIAQSGRDTP
ncbi:MAG TPA: VOC family protein [Terracidiphilus sp.]|jgi:catechol 2,3-dioxygenase-like lactoylglutathione lyase family enzyme|nr:VOC family protein [Terracidiphilus sp.]